jgi:DNA-binding CsgD family transcriptional regulator
MTTESILQPLLSRRQKECLRLIAEGNTARSIATQLGISIRMVRFHLSAARIKLNAVSTSQAVHIAAKKLLLD